MGHCEGMLPFSRCKNCAKTWEGYVTCNCEGARQKLRGFKKFGPNREPRILAKVHKIFCQFFRAIFLKHSRRWNAPVQWPIRSPSHDFLHNFFTCFFAVTCVAEQITLESNKKISKM